MKTIKIADVTLREAELSSTARLSFKEKLEIAKLLEKLNIDIIETGPVSVSHGDQAFIRTLATTLMTSALSVPITLERESVDRAVSALSKAKKARLNLIVPASVVQIEYVYQMKPEVLLSKVREILEYSAGTGLHVELTAEDATRAESEFLAQLIGTGIECGAGTVTLVESTGELLPEELHAFILRVKSLVPGLCDEMLSVHCKDTLGLGSASALAGISAGAVTVRVSQNSAAGTLPLEQFVNIIKSRGETLGLSSAVNATALKRTARQISMLLGQTGNKRGIKQDTSESEVTVRELSGDLDSESLKQFTQELGYELSADDMSRVYSQYKELSRNKKVDTRDIEALIAETAGQAAAIYKLENITINSGTSIIATAVVTLSKDGDSKTAVSVGDGPIDAAILAAEQILGRHFELEEFYIRAVTEGREAMGDALIKLRHMGKLYSGRGLSTDIIGASIRAFLSAVNKIVNEDREQ